MAEITKFAQRLRIMRANRGFSQKEVADALGVHRTTYTKYESTHTPDLEMLVKLARFYGITVDELVGNEILNGASPNEIFANKERFGDLVLEHITTEEKILVMLFRCCKNRLDLVNIIREHVTEENRQLAKQYALVTDAESKE